MARLTQRTTVKPAVAVPRITRARPIKTFYAINPVARPFAGARLYSHTHAALIFTGLLKGRSVGKKTLVRLIGHAALDYHAEEGRFAANGDSISLTKSGIKFFADRAAQPKKVDPELVEDFLTLFRTGAVSERLHIQPNQVEAA